MAKYKVKNTTILHDGVSRGEGSIIELTDLQAKKLEGFVELVKEKAPAKQTENKTKTKTETKKPEVKTEGEEVNLMANKLYQPLLIESVKATADIEQHRFIGFDGAYCTAGAKALGVSDVSIENGQYAPVAVLGTLLVESAGTINVGDPVASDSNGKAVKATGDALINGYAQDSVTEGQEVRVLRGI